MAFFINPPHLNPLPKERKDILHIAQAQFPFKRAICRTPVAGCGLKVTALAFGLS